MAATPDAVDRIAADAAAGTYDSMHLNFCGGIPPPLLARLAAATAAGPPAAISRIASVADQHLAFASLDAGLFSLRRPAAFRALHAPGAADAAIRAEIDAIVEGLHGVVATLGAVPLIRAAKGGPAEAVAAGLDARLREAARAQRGPGGAPAPRAGGPRPLLALFDRSADLATPLAHAWTYRPLVADALGLDLNRVTLPGDGPGAKPVTVEVGPGDWFWAGAAAQPFPAVAESVDAHLKQYRAAVDAVNRLNPKTVALLSKNKDINITRTKGTGNRYGFVALIDNDPYKNHDLMLALKHGIDRQKIIDNVFSGFASMGNDQTVGPADRFYNAALKAKAYDPDKAAFHFKKAGSPGGLEAQVSEGCYSGATDSGVIFQETLKKAGIGLEVKRVSGDGYWDNVWMKAPFCSVFWGNRPTADLQISTQFLSGDAWNDTHFASAAMDKLVIAARIELNEGKRREMYAEAQRLISEDAGMVCFAVGDQMDGGSKKLRGLESHARYDMNDNRLAEKGWFA